MNINRAWAAFAFGSLGMIFDHKIKLLQHAPAAASATNVFQILSPRSPIRDPERSGKK
jgi:hypothetical protein